MVCCLQGSKELKLNGCVCSAREGARQRRLVFTLKPPRFAWGHMDLHQHIEAAHKQSQDNVLKIRPICSDTASNRRIYRV